MMKEQLNAGLKKKENKGDSNVLYYLLFTVLNKKYSYSH